MADGPDIGRRKRPNVTARRLGLLVLAGIASALALGMTYGAVFYGLQQSRGFV